MSNNPNDLQPPGQNPYGNAPGYGNVPGYGATPGYYGGAMAMQPEHPQAVTILVLGICSVVLLPLLGPVAWYMGSQARRDVAASPVGYSNSSMITIGWVLGIVATCLMIATVVMSGIMLVFFIVIGSMTSGLS